MSELLVLSEADVRRLLPMDECIELMAGALSDLARGRAWQPLRWAVRPPEEESLFGLMPAHRSEPSPAYGLKAVCIFPGNPAKGLDAHQGGVLLFDGETGQLRALLEGSAVTAVRTAAVSAVATRALARADATELAILGAGVQARSHLEAMAALGRFERARLWSRTPTAVEALIAEADAPFLLEAASSAEDALRGADVVVTTTSAREPIVERAWFAPGTHVNAVGSSIPTTRELDTETMQAAALFADARESLVNESGDYLLAGLGPEDIRAELGEVLIGSGEGRRDDGELTVFKSLGLAVEDLASAEHVYARALAEGAGSSVSF
jgi:ornithine cyclodeaminase/alanine dehydrogenase-like protein (mu-crystallin family)